MHIVLASLPPKFLICINVGLPAVISARRGQTAFLKVQDAFGEFAIVYSAIASVSRTTLTPCTAVCRLIEAAYTPISLWSQRSRAFIFLAGGSPKSAHSAVTFTGAERFLLKSRTTTSPPASGPAHTSVAPGCTSSVRARHCNGRARHPQSSNSVASLLQCLDADGPVSWGQLKLTRRTFQTVGLHSTTTA